MNETQQIVTAINELTQQISGTGLAICVGLFAITLAILSKR